MHNVWAVKNFFMQITKMNFGKDKTQNLSLRGVCVYMHTYSQRYRQRQREERMA